MRRLENWIDSYLKYTEDTESAKSFNLWSGISAIAGALSKKVSLGVGRLTVYPNLYIVLVAEPGIARKSQAITYMSEIVAGVPSIKVSADSTTTQALLESLENSIVYTQFSDGRIFRYSAVNVISKEFESIMGTGGAKLRVTLTDLFDAGETPWKHKTKQYGDISIPAVFLNVLGATVPKALSTCLSELAVGGGLTSRILFIYSDDKARRIAIPSWTDELVKLKDDLIADLGIIAEMQGVYKFTENAKDFWIDWYTNYDEAKSKRIESRWEFDGWYTRKPLLIQKVSMCLAASRHSDLFIEECDLLKAIEYIEHVEKSMGNIYSESGCNELDGSSIYKYIKEYKRISEVMLMHFVWREFNETEFFTVVKRLIESGKCVREVSDEVYYLIKES